jgi:hypothetical protein
MAAVLCPEVDTSMKWLSQRGGHGRVLTVTVAATAIGCSAWLAGVGAAKMAP